MHPQQLIYQTSSTLEIQPMKFWPMRNVKTRFAAWLRGRRSARRSPKELLLTIRRGERCYRHRAAGIAAIT